MDMDLQQEHKRLAACLHKANAQAEQLADFLRAQSRPQPSAQHP